VETRAETIQILSQIQTEINKAIGESQAQVAQSQNELNATKLEAAEPLHRTFQELESVRN
jgi:hypothetical protein